MPHCNDEGGVPRRPHGRECLIGRNNDVFIGSEQEDGQGHSGKIDLATERATNVSGRDPVLAKIRSVTSA